MMDIYEKVTNQIIELLEKGNLSWVKGWKSGQPLNYLTKKEYNGINIFLLNMHASMHGFKKPYYITYRQLKELSKRDKKNYHVKAGSKAQLCAKYDTFEKKVKKRNKNGRIEEEVKTIPFMKAFWVFNVEQTNMPVKEEKKAFNSIEACEDIIAGYTDKPEIRTGGNSAFYHPLDDYIQLPPRESFNSEEEFYSTAFHEITHSTGHQSRLQREGIVNMGATFGGAAYSNEEVIAELGSAFLCAVAHVEKKVINNNAAYIRGWLKELRRDKKHIFKMASEAQKAADYITGKTKNTKVKQ